MKLSSFTSHHIYPTQILENINSFIFGSSHLPSSPPCSFAAHPYYSSRVQTSIHLQPSIHIFINSSINLSHQSTYKSIYLFVNLSLAIYSSIHQIVYSSIHLQPSIHQYIYLSIRQFIFSHLFIYTSIHIYICSTNCQCIFSH